jgi:probable HAF family extracellular repeat protein/cysteine-rich repeat protein
VRRWTFAATALAIAFPQVASALLVSPQQGADVRGWTYAINDANQMVGYLGTAQYWNTPYPIHAFLAGGGPEAVDLGTLGGTSSAAVAISESGLVTGWADLSGGARHAFLYSNGVMTDLGTLGGTASVPYAVNNAGDVVGWSHLVGNVARHAFLYRAGTMIDLGTLGGTNSDAYGVNESGVVIGSAQLANDTETHAFAWSNGTMTDLGTLGGTFSEARALNETGGIVGNSKTAGDAESHAFVYSGATMQDLGTLGGDESGALDINESGEAAGFAEIADGTKRPFVWTGGVMTDVAASIPGTYGFAAAINDAGEIAGLITRTESGHSVQRAFAWSFGTLTIQTDGSSSMASDINNAGHSVGVFLGLFQYYDGEEISTELVNRPAVWLGRCGNGTVDPGEECDDGNIWRDDCCSATCTADPAGSVCADDGVICNADLCDGLGMCVHTDEPRPADTCLPANRARFDVNTDAPGVSSDRVDWRWTTDGSLPYADLGDPSTATNYALCIWDFASGTPALATAIEPGKDDLWQSRAPKSWTYGRGETWPGGVKTLKISAGEDGSASAKLSARGLSVAMPTAVSATRFFAEDSKTVVQLMTSDGLCMTSEFSGARRNDGTRYSAKQ